MAKGYQYNDYGVTKETGSSNVKNSVKYTGAVEDKATGLYYMMARHYNPQSGRFVQQDTYKGELDTLLSQNQYTYTWNNPVNMVDPIGHAAICYRCRGKKGVSVGKTYIRGYLCNCIVGVTAGRIGNVLSVAHHPGAVEVGATFLAALAPTYWVVSAALTAYAVVSYKSFKGLRRRLYNANNGYGILVICTWRISLKNTYNWRKRRYSKVRTATSFGCSIYPQRRAYYSIKNRQGGQTTK